MARTPLLAAWLLTPVLAAWLLRYFLKSVQAAGGRFVHIKTGKARPQRQAAPAGSGGHWDGPEVLSAPGTSASAEVILTAECPVVAYRQGAADLCAAYGHASEGRGTERGDVDSRAVGVYTSCEEHVWMT